MFSIYTTPKHNLCR